MKSPEGLYPYRSPLHEDLSFVGTAKRFLEVAGERRHYGGRNQARFCHAASLAPRISTDLVYLGIIRKPEAQARPHPDEGARRRH